MSDPREKLHVIVRMYDEHGCPSMVSEYETVTISKVLEHVYAFSIGRHDNAVRMTVDISYPSKVVCISDEARMFPKKKT